MASGPPIYLPLTTEQLRDKYAYDPETGDLIYRVKPFRGRRKAGDVAGCVCDGRWRITIGTVPYLRSRLVWAYHHADPFDQTVDHINRDKLDDRIENLRIAERSQQNANQKLNSRNTSGHRSVYYDRGKGLWAVRLSVFGKRKRFGMYQTAEEAGQVANKIGREAYGEFWAG